MAKTSLHPGIQYDGCSEIMGQSIRQRPYSGGRFVGMCSDVDQNS